MHAFIRFLDARSRASLLTAALLIIALLGAADYLAGPEVRFYIFYWPPIALVAWYAGRRWGLVYVALSGLAWTFANFEDYRTRSLLGVAIWNTAVNVASFALLSLLISTLRQIVNRERDTARVDYMTGAANARAFYPVLQREIARSRRQGRPLTLAYLDVDDFKQVNDRFGHAAGDALLQVLARSILQDLRGSDVLARLGGDEFAVLLPETDAPQARAVLDRLLERSRAALSEKAWTVSLSIGVITCSGPPCSADDLLSRADGLMYEVKVAGKGAIRHLVLPAGGRAPDTPHG